MIVRATQSSSFCFHHIIRVLILHLQALEHLNRIYWQILTSFNQSHLVILSLFMGCIYLILVILFLLLIRLNPMHNNLLSLGHKQTLYYLRPGFNTSLEIDKDFIFQGFYFFILTCFFQTKMGNPIYLLSYIHLFPCQLRDKEVRNHRG